MNYDARNDLKIDPREILFYPLNLIWLLMHIFFGHEKFRWIIVVHFLILAVAETLAVAALVSVLASFKTGYLYWMVRGVAAYAAGLVLYTVVDLTHRTCIKR